MLLNDQVHELVSSVAAIADDAGRSKLLATSKRLDDSTLRIAIAGRVKAGKSTLLNALVGEAVAPTDAAECTKVVTHYSNGPAYQVWLHPADGTERRPVQFSRTDGKAHIELGDTPVEAIDHLHVEFPSDRLEHIEIVDTPGLASISEGVSARSEQFLFDTNDTSGVDVVLYLLRHLHERDVDFLEAFGGGNDRPANPAMAIGVLSRADEIGGGRADAIGLATQIAEHYRNEPRLRRHIQTVVPISGLLAYTAATLRQAEFELLVEMSSMPTAEVDRATLAVELFLDDARLPSTSIAGRTSLLNRFGLFGIRHALALIRLGRASTAGQLAEALSSLSGIAPLRSLIGSQFAGRQSVLKADLALTLVEQISWTLDKRDRRRVRSEIERIRLDALEIRELEALNELRTEPPTDLSDEELSEAERLLGGLGTTPAARMGLEEITDADRFSAHVSTKIDEWNARENRRPSSRQTRHLAAVVVASLTDMYVDETD